MIDQLIALMTFKKSQNSSNMDMKPLMASLCRRRHIVKLS